jgi:uncharacterized membrane protein YhaH (DUF805 family)
MLSLKWGDALSILLPGALALFAIASWFPRLADRVRSFEKVGVGEGFALLIGAVLMGGVLEAFTRVVWEKYWLVRRYPPMDVLSKLTPDNLELYERGVQSSYKYVTFYANFAWAAALLLVSRWHDGTTRFWSIWTLILLAVVGRLLRASHVQWAYYVNYQTRVIREEKK